MGVGENSNSTHILPAGSWWGITLKITFYGALMGLVFSSSSYHLTFQEIFPIPSLMGLFSGTILFGLPAGIILAFIDSRKGKKSGWQNVIKVPFMIFGGGIFIFGILTVPLAIALLARLGSEWLAGGVGNYLLMQVIGLVSGAFIGLVISVTLLAKHKTKLWMNKRLIKHI